MDADLQGILAKTLDTSATNGNAYLNPPLLSAIIAEQARRLPVLRNALPREPFKGKTYLFDVENAPGDAATAADGATITLSDAIYSQGSVEMSYFYFATQITNPAIVATQELINLVEDRSNKAVKAILRKEGSVIFNGDSLGAPKTSGIYAQLAAGPRFINGGAAGQTLSPSTLDYMAAQMLTDGYDPSQMVFCMTPRMATAVRAFAFNHYRAVDISAGANYGFPIGSSIQWNGIPVLCDPYAAKNVSVTGETLTLVSGKTYSFANPNVVQFATATGTDMAGTAETAPVLKFAGVVQAPNTYSFSVSAAGVSQVTFTGTPATVTSDYVWKQENVYLLSLNKSDIVIPESLPVTVDANIFAPVTQDIIPLRVKQYSSVVVKNTYAHVLASNVLYAPITQSLVGP